MKTGRESIRAHEVAGWASGTPRISESTTRFLRPEAEDAEKVIRHPHYPAHEYPCLRRSPARALKQSDRFSRRW